MVLEQLCCVELNGVVGSTDESLIAGQGCDRSASKAEDEASGNSNPPATGEKRCFLRAASTATRGKKDLSPLFRHILVSHRSFLIVKQARSSRKRDRQTGEPIEQANKRSPRRTVGGAAGHPAHTLLGDVTQRRW